MLSVLSYSSHLKKYKMKQLYLYIFLLLIAISCVDDPESDIIIPKGRTLLVYLAGDNSLSDEVSDIFEALKEGWDPMTMGQLVILADSKNDDKPMLIKFGKRKGIIIADTLRKYENKNSASSELLSQVIADMKVIAPGENYGMMLFSHASGWLPEKAFLDPIGWGAPSGDKQNITPRSIFEDTKREMELSDFAAAIPDGMFEFIASEMCFMSSVETAYALRNKTQYLLAAAPEMLSPGFTPIYKTSLDLLYKSEADLEGFGQAYFNYVEAQEGAYRSGAISLVQTSEMEALAELTREIAPELNQEQIDMVQFYDRNGKPHVFFDYGDYMRLAATPEQFEKFEELLSKAVIFKRNTPKLINIDIKKHSGLSVYIPQEALPRLNDAYKKTEWWKSVKN